LLDKQISYQCINCGECCKKLLIERQGVLKGLPLLSEERILFRRDVVKPGFGLGTLPGEHGFTIISYQMTRAVCPNHAYGGCTVWINRPAICRAYPIVPMISQGLKIVKTFDMTCTALKDDAKKWDGVIVPLEPSSVESERTGYNQVVKITEQILSNVNHTWFYDLKTFNWVKFTEMLKKE
jgi:Fe-S-cluster containining protein